MAVNHTTLHDMVHGLELDQQLPVLLAQVLLEVRLHCIDGFARDLQG
jgi:hypothetical protein